MEPITLCGLIILIFGMWVEFEPALKAVTRTIRKSNLFAGLIPQPTAQRPVYVRRMPICLAKTSHY
jgi:hypothetical protein